jgi:hypothetical protein
MVDTLMLLKPVLAIAVGAPPVGLCLGLLLLIGLLILVVE